MRPIIHLILIPMLVLLQAASWACTTVGGVRNNSRESQDWTLAQALDKSPIILVGRVLAVKPAENQVHVLVTRSLRGETPKEFWLSGFVFDGLLHSSLCEYKRLNRVEVDWTYLMFMDRMDGERMKILMHRWLETDKGQRSPLQGADVLEVEQALAKQ